MELLSNILSAVLSFSFAICLSLFLFGIRLEKRKHGRWVLYPSLALLLRGPGFYNYFTGDYFWIRSYTQLGWYNFSFVLYWVSARAVFYFTYKTSFKNVLFYGIAAYTFQNFSANLRDIIRYVFFSGERGMPFKLLSLGLRALLYSGYYFFLIRRRDQRNPESTLNNWYLIVFLGVTIFTVNIYRQYWSYHSRSDRNVYDEIEIYGTVFSLICTLVRIVLQFGLFEESKLKKENQVIEHVLSQSVQNQKNREQQANLVNRKFHDIKRQVEVLKTIEDDKEKKETIQQLEESIRGYDLCVRTGNKTLDVLFSNARATCSIEHIDLSVRFDGKSFSFIKPADLYSLFSNAIDNAIECVRKYEEMEKRQISIHSTCERGILEARIENYCQESLSFEDGVPTATSKEDKDFHGFGTRSISYIAGKYNGIAKRSIENNRFILTLVFVLS